jgi:hypothetical protein
MARMNWSGNRSRQRITRYGSNDIHGREPSVVLPFLKNRPRTPKSSKAALREQTGKAIRAFAGAITKELTCKHCRHVGTANIPTDRPGAVLYCRECGCTV